MGQKDLAQTDYFNDKARFADACNGILFRGEEVIRPEDLQEPYVMNYRMNLFDYHDHDDFSCFHTENRELFEVLSCAKDEGKMN